MQTIFISRFLINLRSRTSLESSDTTQRSSFTTLNFHRDSPPARGFTSIADDMGESLDHSREELDFTEKDEDTTAVYEDGEYSTGTDLSVFRSDRPPACAEW